MWTMTGSASWWYRLGISTTVAMLLWAATAPPRAPVTEAARGTDCQQLAVMAYRKPGTYWKTAVAGAPTTGLMVFSPNLGPGRQAQREWQTRARLAQAEGITVLGYIRTDLTKKRPARVRREIRRYYDWYGVDGIYFDVATGKKEDRGYYRKLARSVRKRDAGATVALNPAKALDRGYLRFVDILEIFEYDYQTYRTKLLPKWIQNFPARRFIHVIYGVPNADAARRTLRLAKERNAGNVFITQVSNPDRIYASLGQYWNLQLKEAC